MIEDTEYQQVMTSPQNRADMRLGKAIRRFYALKRADILDYLTIGETKDRTKFTAIVRPRARQILFATSEDYNVVSKDLTEIIEIYWQNSEFNEVSPAEDEVPF